MINYIEYYILIFGILLSPNFTVAEEFTYDFSTDEWQPLVFKAIGAKSGHPGKQVDGGVLISVSGKSSKKTQVGYATRFAVTGDFEFTVGYKLKELARPEKGYGTGVMINLYKTDRERVNFSRSLKSDGKHKFSTAFWTKKKGNWTPDVERFPAENDQGELKLVRKGGMLTFLTKDGDSLEFNEIRQIKFGAEPVSRIELLADTGGDQQELQILFTRLSMSADKMLHSSAPLPETETFLTSWGLWGGSGVIIIAVLSIIIWHQRQ